MKAEAQNRTKGAESTRAPDSKRPKTAKLTLATRIYLGYALVTLTFGAVSIYGVIALHEIGREISAVSKGYLPLAKAVAQIETFHKNRMRETSRLLEEKEQKPRQSLIMLAKVYFPQIIREKLSSAASIASQNKSIAPQSERKFLGDLDERIVELSKLYEQYEQACDLLFTFIEDKDQVDRESEQVRSVAMLERRIDREIKVLNLILDQRVSDRVNGAEKLERRSAWTIIVLSLFAIAMGFLATWMAGRLLAPIRILTEGVTRIGVGDYSAEVPLSAHDEIGVLAREFNAMAKALRERQIQLDEKHQALVRAERLAAIGRISAQITHEVRNPLSSLGLNAEMLEEALADAHFDNAEQGEEARHLVASMVREADRLAEITEQYLRFARFPNPVLEAQDPNEILDSLLDFVEEENTRAGIVIERRFAQNCPRIIADQSQLRQALMNLLRNSREALVHGGTIKVETKPLVTYVEIRVSDTGPGIPPAELSRVFDPFFSTKERGTGLGLALTQQIINEHGGSIRCESKIGKGTSFILELKRAPS